MPPSDDVTGGHVAAPQSPHIQAPEVATGPAAEAAYAAPGPRAGELIEQPAFKAAAVELYARRIAVAPVVEGLRPDATATYNAVLNNVFGGDGLAVVPADLLPDAGRFARDVDSAFEQTWRGYRGEGVGPGLTWHQSHWDEAFGTLQNGLADAARFVQLSHQQLAQAEAAAAETVHESGVTTEIGDAVLGSYAGGMRQTFAGLRDGLLNQPFRNAYGAWTRFSETMQLTKGVGSQLGSAAAQFAWRDAAQSVFDTAVREWSAVHDGMAPSSVAAGAAHVRFAEGAQALFTTDTEPSAATFGRLVPGVRRALDLGAAIQDGIKSLKTQFDDAVSGLPAGILAAHGGAAWGELYTAARDLLTAALEKDADPAVTAAESAQALRTQISALGASARPRVLFTAGVQALTDGADQTRSAAIVAAAAELGEVPPDVLERVADAAADGASDAVEAQTASLRTAGYTLPNVQQALLKLAGALDGVKAGLPAALTHDLQLSEALTEAGEVYADLVEDAGLPEELAGSIGHDFRAHWAEGWQAEVGGGAGFDVAAMLDHEAEAVDRFGLAFSSRWSPGPGPAAVAKPATVQEPAALHPESQAQTSAEASAQPHVQGQTQPTARPSSDGGIAVGEVLSPGDLAAVQRGLGSGNPVLAAQAMNGLVKELGSELTAAILAGVPQDVLAAGLAVILHIADEFPLAGVALAHTVAGSLQLRVELVFDDTPTSMHVCAPIGAF